MRCKQRWSKIKYFENLCTSFLLETGLRRIYREHNYSTLAGMSEKMCRDHICSVIRKLLVIRSRGRICFENNKAFSPNKPFWKVFWLLENQLNLSLSRFQRRESFKPERKQGNWKNVVMLITKNYPPTYKSNAQLQIDLHQASVI